MSHGQQVKYRTSLHVYSANVTNFDWVASTGQQHNYANGISFREHKIFVVIEEFVCVVNLL